MFKPPIEDPTFNKAYTDCRDAAITLSSFGPGEEVWLVFLTLDQISRVALTLHTYGI